MLSDYRYGDAGLSALPSCQNAFVTHENRCGAATCEGGDVVNVMPSLRQAANQGDAWAQFILGLIHDNGQGVPQDFVEAAKWYRKAAYQHHAEAQFTLGIMHINGEGVGKDYVMAHMWFSLAARHGFEVAAKNRDITASLMTPQQLADARRLEQGWKPRR